ncbi:MAG: N-acetylornithine carbamoyltransferase [Deltaproteobacteria bacterium]|nr:N-acetylornithine carbamoyltransferase [Deltaproteobacteria bacterium]
MHFFDGTEYGADGALTLAARALELRAGATPRAALGKRLAAVFLNPSLRTRASMEAATTALGASPQIIQPGKDAWSLEVRKGVVMDGSASEHIADAVRVLGQYADILAVRAFPSLVDLEEDRAEPVLSAFMEHAGVPVINLESALYHPMQGLADTATWLDHLGPDLRGQPITLTWAPHPKALPASVPNQVLLSSALVGMDVTVAHPEGFELDPQLVARAEGLAAAGGGRVRITHDQAGAMKGARVVVAKSWSGFSGYGRREEEAAHRATLGGWTVDQALMDLSDQAGFMHCLPVRRNVVVSDAVLDGPNSWAFEEAGLRLWTAMALLEKMWGGAR